MELVDTSCNVLFFTNDVQVERIVLAYGLEDLLVEVGSCLGLWLGLSIVGVFDLAAVAVQLTAKLFKQRRNGSSLKGNTPGAW